jgi:hypothetical protein
LACHVIKRREKARKSENKKYQRAKKAPLEGATPNIACLEHFHRRAGRSLTEAHKKVGGTKEKKS